MMIDLPLKAFRQPLSHLPAHMTKIVKPRKFAPVMPIEEDISQLKVADNSISISDLDRMTESELQDLRIDFCREWMVLSAFDSFQDKNGWYTHFASPKIPIYDYHDFLVWLCWELFTSVPLSYDQ